MPKTPPTYSQSSAGINFIILALIALAAFGTILAFCVRAEAAQPGDSVAEPPPVIDSIEIHAGNVFDLSDSRQNNILFRLANRTHIITRKSVIRRELMLREGDVFDSALISESLRNLRGLRFVLDTDIHMKTGARGEHIMVVETTDKWTAYPRFSYMRSGGRNDLRMSLTENNFLGYGIEMSHRYYILEDDRDFYQMEFRNDRVWNYDFSLYLFYSDDPRAGEISTVVGRPFYSLEQKFGGEFAYTHLRRRLDYYIAQFLSAQERYNLDNFQLQLSYRVGGSYIKYHFTPKYVYTDLRSRNRNIYVPDVDTLLPKQAQDTVSHYVEFAFRIQQINYAVFRRINRFYKPEDINIGWDARISAGSAFWPGFRRSIYQHYAIKPQYTFAGGRNLCIAGIGSDLWFSGGTKIRRDINGYFIYYGQFHRKNTLAIRASYISIRLKEASYTLYLDEDFGVRGYPAYSYNGEDRLIFTLENRYFSDIEILTVGLGAAAFVDIGNIWTRNGSPTIDETKYSFGVGLRFGISRSTNAEVVRVDFAYAPRRGKWEISVGTGQYF